MVAAQGAKLGFVPTFVSRDSVSTVRLAERDGPGSRLERQQCGCGRSNEVPREKFLDGLVPDAENPRIDESADTHGETAEDRPPHPVHRKLCEQILAGVEQRGDEPGREARRQPDERREPALEARGGDRSAEPAVASAPPARTRSGCVRLSHSAQAAAEPAAEDPLHDAELRALPAIPLR